MSLLGRGGMGEVYRADDLRLGQPVALKFLPEEAVRGSGRLDRFHNEVRLARRVSHPHVCRVYDIGDVDAHHFISMEYIDGEDLASLLLRIGRIPPDKAVQIARQLCAGLAAAHESGVLHLDLKPGNVMIDGRGRARITDFGLAAIAAAPEKPGIISGTPLYMAPEQLAGTEATVRSDIYALGLVLYEIFTGRRPFEAESIESLRLARSESNPPALSSHVSELDPAVERVILRCLASDPLERPGSALAVAAALPVADPLAAALAAGETPAPEVVAAAGEIGALPPGVALACLLAILAGVAVIVLFHENVALSGMVPLDKPPEALAERARSLLGRLGHGDSPRATAYGFVHDRGYVEYVGRNDPRPGRWEVLSQLRPAAINFWYRQSQDYLIPTMAFRTDKVTPRDPPPVLPGMASVLLNPDGRLVAFEAVPSETEGPEEPEREPDWSTLFEEAGLNPSTFRAAAPSLDTAGSGGTEAAWEGIYQGASPIPVRIEAAALRGVPVRFRIEWPWGGPGLPAAGSRHSGPTAGATYMAIFIMTLIPVAAMLARRNLRLGRGDRKGAIRVTLFVFVSRLLLWFFRTGHVPVVAWEWERFEMGAARALFLSGLAWLLYTALEPLVRRRWPDSIIAWSRLLAGRLRDPLVGRDCLVGTLTGTVCALSGAVTPLVLKALELPSPPPIPAPLDALGGPGWLAGQILGILLMAPLVSMQFLMILLVPHMIFRRMWITIGFCMLLFTPMGLIWGGFHWTPVEVLLAGISTLALIYTLLRFGLLAVMVAFFVLSLFITVPITTDLSSWHLETTVTALVAVTVLATYGFRTSLAGRPILEARSLEG